MIIQAINFKEKEEKYQYYLIERKTLSKTMIWAVPCDEVSSGICGQ